MCHRARKQYYFVGLALFAFTEYSSELKVQGSSSGLSVQGSGFRDQGAGYRVQGSGFRVEGSGFRVQSRFLQCHAQVPSGVGSRLQVLGFRV